ncbi:hypothetical protein ACQKWADRAFT_138241, partial [Trichoderma austrokoningii]
MEKKAERNGNPIKHYPQSNQGRKRDDYVAKDNGTRPGRMDIDAINHKKFNETCSTCGKKGHRGADCRSKMTCGFCGKNGHDEAHCYTKKNARKPETSKDKAQIDAITEVPHDHLSWTACYDDSCLVHKDSKDGSGYYPKKPRAKKSHKTVRIDTLNFYERPSDGSYDQDGDSNFSAETICEHCGSIEPTHECEGKRVASWRENYSCDNCYSRDYNHECHGCPDCGSMEGYQHSCEGEWRRNMEAMYELFEEEERLVKEYFEEQEQINTLPDAHPFANKGIYECEICESTDLDHDCNGCHTCGSYDPKHDCMYVLGEQAEKQERQEERRKQMLEFPPE